MNLCIVTHSYPRFEHDPSVKASNFIPQFALQLIEAGHRVCVFTPNTEGPKEDIGTIEVCWYRWQGSDKHLRYWNLYNPRDLKALFSLLYQGKRQLLPFLKQNGIERLLAIWAIPGGYLARYAMKKSGIPYDVWIRGTDVHVWGKRLLAKQIIKEILKEAEGCFSVSDDGITMATKLIARHYEMLPASRQLPRVNVLPHPMDSEYTNLLFVGRLSDENGIKVLIEAMKRVVRDYNGKCRLYIIGDGVLEKWLSDSIQDLENNISYVGSAFPEKLISYYQSADALVIPILYHVGFPCVFSEAMQMRLPVIASDMPNMKSIIEKYNVGLTFKSGDPEDLARQIINFNKGLHFDTSDMAEIAEFRSIDRSVHYYLTCLEKR